MENLLVVLCVPIIVAVVYVTMTIYKHIVQKHSEVLTRIIPLFAAILGAVLGIYGFYRVPSIMLSDNLFICMIVGIVSGLGAVGLHQVGKQLGRPEKESEVKKEDPETTEMKD